MEAKHWKTDLRWTFLGHDHDVLYVRDENEVVAQVWRIGGDVGLSLIEQKTKTEANARLIAAAPDLLAAAKIAIEEVKAMAEMLGNDHEMTLSWSRLNDAIAKTEEGIHGTIS
jgi:hypothetical protein